MYVYISFDVEDLVHPDSDDIALDIAQMLAGEGVIGSMCVVGEKARLWERRGRTDVIAAMRPHDLSLHTDRHSMHPTPSEYLADKGWADGVAEAVVREGPGARDIARLFGRPPSAWATPGHGWGPQIPAATRRLGIPANLYSHARAGDTGACWYAGQLCYSDPVSLPHGEDDLCDDAAFEAGLPLLLGKIAEAQHRGCACLGIAVGHPTRLRYAEFWDLLNYARGEDTDPAHYRFAPRRSDEAYAAGLRNLRHMALAVRDLPGVEVISVGALNERFRPENGGLARGDLLHLAEAIVAGGEIVPEDPRASPAQTLDALARAALARADGSDLPACLALRTVLGPAEAPPVLQEEVTVPTGRRLPWLRELVGYIDATGHLPASLTLGGVPVGPGPLLRALAAVLLDLARGVEPDQATIAPGAEEPLAAASLAERIYQRVPTWPAHRPELRLDLLALHARLQSWSLKPAVLL